MGTCEFGLPIGWWGLLVACLVLRASIFLVVVSCNRSDSISLRIHSTMQTIWRFWIIVRTIDEQDDLIHWVEADGCCINTFVKNILDGIHYRKVLKDDLYDSQPKNCAKRIKNFDRFSTSTHHQGVLMIRHIAHFHCIFSQACMTESLADRPVSTRKHWMGPSWSISVVACMVFWKAWWS